MDFFKPECQSGPFSQERFGLCDDQNATPAYIDTTTPEKWVATVENPARKAVTFTAIYKCVIQDGDEPSRGRCDGMLTTEDLLYMVRRTQMSVYCLIISLHSWRLINHVFGINSN